MSDIRALTGVIKKVSQKPKTYGVLINETWYNGFKVCPVKEGQEVVLEFVQEEWMGKPSMKIKSIEVSKSVLEQGFKPQEKIEVIVPVMDDLIQETKKYSNALLMDVLKESSDEDKLNYVIQMRERVFRELMLDRRTKIIQEFKK